MFVNNYSVRIPEGSEDGSGYVAIAHGKKYSLVLRNNHPTQCNAHVEIDGKHQGTWRIPAKKAIAIERPAHDEGRFTFYQLGSAEGDRVGLSPNDPNLGLVKITFTPEKVFDDFAKSPQVYYGVEGSKGLARSLSDRESFGVSKKYAAGGTGLSGRSNQSFDHADEIMLDYSKSTTINLRLVADSFSDEPRPLTNYSNPIPPPVH